MARKTPDTTPNTKSNDAVEREAQHRAAVADRADEIRREKNWTSKLIDLAKEFVAPTDAAPAAPPAYTLIPADLLAGDPRAFAELDRMFACDNNQKADNAVPLHVDATTGAGAADTFGSNTAYTARVDGKSRLAPYGSHVTWGGYSEHFERWLARRYRPEQYDSLLRRTAVRVVVTTGPGARDHVVFVRVGGEWQRWQPDVSDERLRERDEDAARRTAERVAEERAAENFRQQITSNPNALLRLAQRLGIADQHGNLTKETP